MQDEASKIKRVLRESGVPDSVMIVEPKARNTHEMP